MPVARHRQDGNPNLVFDRKWRRGLLPLVRQFCWGWFLARHIDTVASIRLEMGPWRSLSYLDFGNVTADSPRTALTAVTEERTFCTCQYLQAPYNEGVVCYPLILNMLSSKSRSCAQAGIKVVRIAYNMQSQLCARSRRLPELTCPCVECCGFSVSESLGPVSHCCFCRALICKRRLVNR